MSVTGRKLAKRACDGCKIRKIKCTEVAPCEGCLTAGIACTFIKQPSTRGPRRLRKSTLREIAQSQQQWEDLGYGSVAPDEPVVHTKLDAESVFAPNKVAALVLQLCVYRLRMYPVWPIIKVERLVASLQRPEPDIEVFGLAYAVAAATIAQIRTKPSTQPGAVTAEMMEAQCQYAKVRRNRDQRPDLTTVRIPFFLHMYYENLEPGGLQSITYLREAIAIAHMVGLHRETYYLDVQPEEREIRRRTLWLLFVAERNVSIAHRLPVTIRTKMAFPSTIDSDSEHVLAAYQRLVVMFWEFDRSGVFELLDRCDFDFSKATGQAPPPGLMVSLIAMRKRLDGTMISVESMEDTQAFDLLITRQWMRMILWRLTHTQARTMQTPEKMQAEIFEPIKIAQDLLSEIVHIPENAIEAHSSVSETKIYEITTSLVDAIQESSELLNSNISNENSSTIDAIKEALIRLRGLLSRNDDLSMRLQNHIEHVQQELQLYPSISSAVYTAIEGQSKLANTSNIDSNASLEIWESPASSTDLLSGSQASLSPHSYWAAQQVPHNSLLGSSNVTATDSFNFVVQGPLEQNYLDMDWSQYGYSPGAGDLVTEHDMSFALNEN